MHCMTCGAEMLLMHTVPDAAIEVAGFEHQTFMCSVCYDIERRLVFIRQERDADGVPLHASPPISPAVAQSPPRTRAGETAARGLLARVLARLRGA